MRRVQVGRGVTSTAPGAGQGRACLLLAAAPRVRGPLVAVCGPGTTPRRRAFLSPGGAIRPGLSEAGAKCLSRFSAYAAEQRL